jgi:hypothetical protein
MVHDVHHSPPCIAEVKNEWSYIYTPLIPSWYGKGQLILYIHTHAYTYIIACVHTYVLHACVHTYTNTYSKVDPFVIGMFPASDIAP